MTRGLLVAARGLFSCGTWTLAVAVDFLVATCGLLVAACGHLVASCMWDLVPRPGIERGPAALGARSLTHWTTRGVPTTLS